MAAPLIFNRQVLLAKIETTPGTAIALTGTDGAYNVFNVDIQDETEFVERMGQGTLSRLTGSIAGRVGRATFSMWLIGGTPSSPAWMPVFLPSCGLGQASLIYTVTSAPPEAAASTSKNITIGIFENGIFKQLHGAFGTAVFHIMPGRPSFVEFEYLGVYTEATDVSLPAPTYPTTMPPRVVSATAIIGSFAPKFSELTIALNNEMYARPDAAAAKGVHSVVMTDRRITGHFDGEAHLVASWDPGADFAALTERVLDIAIGSGGNQISFDAPKLQYTAVRQANRNGLLVNDCDFQLNRSASAGDDELVITSA